MASAQRSGCDCLGRNDGLQAFVSLHPFKMGHSSLVASSKRGQAKYCGPVTTMSFSNVAGANQH